MTQAVFNRGMEMETESTERSEAETGAGGSVGPQGAEGQGTEAERAEAERAEATIPAPGDWGLTPGDRLRALPAEAESRGTRFVSAQAMQARLFSVYDAAAAAEQALALVQQQLTLTLDRQYYEADEIEQMAEQLDSLLLPATELDEGLAAGT